MIDEYTPTYSELLACWQIFTTNVDPVTKILHIPSFGRDFIETNGDCQSSDIHLRALVLSVCYAAVTSMMPSEVEILFSRGKAFKMQQMRRATEKALQEADVFASKSLAALQALTLYLVRDLSIIEFLWRLTGDSRFVFHMIMMAMRHGI